jgi:DNA mismatch endonuclease (patch repair protein)
MFQIKSKNTKPELVIRKLLFSKGFRYRLHGRDLPGSPDIILPKYKTVVFVNGCFWHGHECKTGSGSRKPKSNELYWKSKLEKNIERDKITHKKLASMGWNIITIWECEIKQQDVIIDKLTSLLTFKNDISDQVNEMIP